MKHQTENTVSCLFYYMWNAWSREECKVVFGDMHRHFWDKWSALADKSIFGAAEWFFAELSENYQKQFAGRAVTLYDSRAFRKEPEDSEILVYKECGSRQLEVQAWINANTDEQYLDSEIRYLRELQEAGNLREDDIEMACCSLGLDLVRKNGIALEDMCNGGGEFYDEYQKQFNILYDSYGHKIENTSWPDWIGHTIPTNRELIRLLEHHDYKRIEIDIDRGIPRTFYVFRRGLHINASEDLSYHIVPQSDSLGLGRFAVCATKDGESSQLGTDCARIFLERFLAFLKSKRSGKEIVDEICNNQQVER